jgi:hypothetical protein
MKLNNILEQSKRGSAPADAYDGGSGNGGVNSSSETTNNGKRGTDTGGADSVGDNGKRNNPDEKRKPAPAPAPAPPPAPAPTNVFDCLTKADAEIKPKAGTTKYVIDNSMTGSTYIFWDDGDFSVKEKDNLAGVSKFTGKWKCTADGFVIDTNDGDHYDSKTQKWSGVNGGGGGTTLVDTTLTGDDLKGGKSVKKGMKGDIVGKIQQFLIDKGYKNVSKSGKVDNIFGKRTKASVEEFQTNNDLTVDGVVGKDTWPKLNDPKAVTKDNATSTQTSNNNTTGADLQGTGDTYVSGSDAKIMEKDIPDVLKESVKKILRKSLLKHIK